MIPGEIIARAGEIEAQQRASDPAPGRLQHRRSPVQVGSHYHFAETNAALRFDRAAARELPAQHRRRNRGALPRPDRRAASLVAFAGDRIVIGFTVR
jgi:urease subunit beta